MTPSVTVAVLTYRRPDHLAELLPMLVAEARSLSPAASVLVIDNDPDASTAAALSTTGLAAEVRIVHEPTPGIAAARNRALDEASTRLLVFIDDDERPETGWLGHLVAAHERFHADAVAGPVLPRFATEPDAWITAGRFFVHPTRLTGSVRPVAATNNLLLDLDVVRELGLRFDLRYGLTGGSDTVFTRALTAAGKRIVWCAEAPVHDIVPAERATRSWVLRRAYRLANTASRVQLDGLGLGARPVTTAKIVVQGVGRCAVGAVRVALGSLTRNLATNARGHRLIARGRGMLAGAFGSVFAEYSRGPQS
ncbi:MAG TPA: glycosyltransferase [Candidatus Lumbricidophila sp.]|nr:glycosyltransferase [Candidatus Lumbricidophila sp.]